MRSSRFGSDCRLNKRVSWHFCHCRLLGPSSAESRYWLIGCIDLKMELLGKNPLSLVQEINNNHTVNIT